MNAKFQFEVRSTDKTLFTFTFNQRYGVHITDHTQDDPFYLDLNLFNSQKKLDLFVFRNGKTIGVSVQGLTFNDILYVYQGDHTFEGDILVEID